MKRKILSLDFIREGPTLLVPAWLLVAAMLLLWGLGDIALMDPDEGRNISIAWEMGNRGEFLMPYLDGLPFLDKPFFFFTMTALSLSCFGASEFAGRLVPLVFTWATAVLTVWFAMGLFGRRAAWTAGVALLTMPLVVGFSRILIFDSTLTFFVALAIVSLYRAVELPADATASARGCWSALAGVAIAFGIFTKGPVALLIPLLVVMPYGLWRKRARAIFHPATWISLVVLLIPWLWYTEAKMPGFLHYALVTETWERMTTDKLNRTGSVWYFVPYLFGGTFPWLLPVLVGAWPRRNRDGARGREKDHRVVFLLLWLLVPLIFFSLSQSKRPHYILPLMPAAALLAAAVWEDKRAWQGGARAAAICCMLLGGFLLMAAGGLLPVDDIFEPEHAAGIMTTVMHLGLLAAAGGVLMWLASGRRQFALMALSLPMILVPAIVGPLHGRIAEDRSARKLAACLEPHLSDDCQVIGIETFPPSLPFYLDRLVVVSSATGQPFTSNSLLAFYPDWVNAEPGSLRPAEWWRNQLTRGTAQHVFVVKPTRNQDRAVLEAAGCEPLFTSRRLLAFGPCESVEPTAAATAAQTSEGVER